MTGPELRTALAALGLKAADLTRAADAERTDGKKTAATTLSRQVNGQSPVDPWLALYVRALAEARGVDIGAAPPPAPSPAEDRRRRTIEALRGSGLMPGRA